MLKILAWLDRARAVAIVCAFSIGAIALGAGQLRPRDVFADITTAAGITFARHNGASGSKWYPELFGGGVAVLDYNMDGWPDLFVDNDRVPAKLYRNDGHGRFLDEGLRAGVALREQRDAGGNMGVDAADYDRSGRPHLLVGNFFQSAWAGAPS